MCPFKPPAGKKERPRPPPQNVVLAATSLSLLTFHDKQARRHVSPASVNFARKRPFRIQPGRLHIHVNELRHAAHGLPRYAASATPSGVRKFCHEYGLRGYKQTARVELAAFSTSAS